MHEDSEKILIRSSDRNVSYIMKKVGNYAEQLNKTCIPILKDLGLCNQNLAVMIRYSGIGGKEKMRLDYLNKYFPGSLPYKSAESKFLETCQNHSEFEETQIKWKYINFLTISENCYFEINISAIEERTNVYIDNPKNVEMLKDFDRSVITWVKKWITPQRTTDFIKDFRKFISVGADGVPIINPEYIDNDFLFNYRIEADNKEKTVRYLSDTTSIEELKSSLIFSGCSTKEINSIIKKY